MLPEGPGLRAPRCDGVTQDTIYLEDVVGVRKTRNARLTASVTGSRPPRHRLFLGWLDTSWSSG